MIRKPVVRVVPPDITDEERAKRLDEVKAVVWRILERLEFERHKELM
jgi:hypothetical protein